MRREVAARTSSALRSTCATASARAKAVAFNSLFLRVLMTFVSV
jgi:hypothetical protein